MEQRQQKSALVLKYAKRRFDGGNEAELIRAIETANMNKLYNPQGSAMNPISQGFTAPLNLTPHPAAVAPTAAQPAKATRQSRMLEALLRGPLQVCIGVVGMLTASLAIVTFKRANNQHLLQQSWVVFHDCRKTLVKGFTDCLTTPARVLQAGLKKIQ
jgi:hypothetical protein